MYVENYLLRGLLIAAGTLFLGLGLLGIFLPLLPTTPFLLLSAGCYIRSSDRFYDWLINNRLIGSYINNYRVHKGISLRAKIFSLCLLLVSIGYSMMFAAASFYVKIILMFVLVGVGYHIISLKTIQPPVKLGRRVGDEG